MVNEPIPEVEPNETYGYWTTKTSSASLIAVTWCIAEVCPADTLINDLTELSIDLRLAYWINPVPSLNVDSSLALLSDPSGCPWAKNLWVPIPAVVVPKPTILDFVFILLFLSFSICNLTRPFSNLEVMIPTLFVEIPITSSE